MPSFFVVAVDGACVIPEFGFEVTARGGNTLSNTIGGALTSEYVRELIEIATESVDDLDMPESADEVAGYGVEIDLARNGVCGFPDCQWCTGSEDVNGAAGNAFLTPLDDLILRTPNFDNPRHTIVSPIGKIEDYCGAPDQPLGTPDAVSEEAIELAALAAEVDQCSQEFFEALCDFDGAHSDAAKTNTSADIVGEHLDDAFSYLELAKTAFARAKRIALP